VLLFGKGSCPAAICEASSVVTSASTKKVDVFDGVIVNVPASEPRPTFWKGVLYSSSQSMYGLLVMAE
jgi:hypothetical protein